jgi:hypothetical protein
MASLRRLAASGRVDCRKETEDQSCEDLTVAGRPETKQNIAAMPFLWRSRPILNSEYRV